MDLVMPEMNGVEATKEIKKFDPNAKILVLTSFTSNEQVFSAIEAGATGYLLKDSDPEDLAKSIEQVYHGESSLHPLIARKLLNEFTHPSSKDKNLIEALTDREKEVLRFIAQGLSNQDISEEMVVSKATVHTHVSNILSKLQLENRTQAALFAIRKGFVPFPGEDNEIIG
jgi:NarL family two-component system response regulator LiaR